MGRCDDRPATAPGLTRRMWLRRSLLAGVGLVLWRSPARSACAPTAPNPQGPFYLPGAPFREDLSAADEPGQPLRLSGRVLSATSCEPLGGAVLDLWHASDSGMYYGLESPSAGELEPYLLRTRVRCDDQGGYALRTVLPGHYPLSRSRFRARHIHVIVSHPSHHPVITQVYFAGDPHLATDPLARRSLVTALEQSPTGLAGTFDFHLLGS